MEDFIYKELSKEEKTQFHGDLLKHLLGLISDSRNVMEKYYPKWERYDEVFRAHLPMDGEDLKAQRRKEPKKAIVPVTFSIISTFTAFAYAVLTQKPEFYELVGEQMEAENDGRFLAEALLSRDLRESNFFGSILGKLLISYAKHGVSIVRHGWVEEKAYRTVKSDPSALRSVFAKLFGGEAEGELTEEEFVQFMGNRITFVSPFCFFPDTRVPFEKFQEGEFAAFEFEMGYQPLRKLDGQRAIAGLKHVQALSRVTLGSKRRYTARSRLGKYDAKADVNHRSSGNVQKLPYLITEIEVELIPNEWELKGGKLGEEDYPVKYLAQLANDNRIIKLERMNYAHQKFTFEVAQFLCDEDDYLGYGMAEIIEDLQEIITWFINARVTSVRKVIDNRLIIDTTGVNMDDIKQRRPVIRLLNAASGQDVRKFVNQLQLQDVTQTHLTDVQFLNNLVYEVIGISQNMMGQYSPGRRSAREAQSVNVNATNRALFYVRSLWDSMLRPLGKSMLQNHRSGLTAEQYVQAVGMHNAQNPGTLALFAVTADQIAGNYDFKTFDGTLPSERAYMAESIAGMLETLLKVPELIQMYRIDLWALLREWAILRGIRYPERFQLPEQPQQQQQGVVDDGQSTGVPPDGNDPATAQAPAGFIPYS